MTKTKRVGNILLGILILLFAAALFRSPEEGLPIVVVIIGIMLSLRGAGSLLYYFRMARYMVGGKYALYRGMIFLDLGLFTASLVDNPLLVIIAYIVVVEGIEGLVAILRAAELKQEGSEQWMYRAANGVLSLAVAAAVILCRILQYPAFIIVYIFAVGIALSAVRRIVRAFRKTAIVYIP